VIGSIDIPVVMTNDSLWVWLLLCLIKVLVRDLNFICMGAARWIH